MNPFNQSNQINPEMRELYKMMCNGTNPMQLLTKMASQNPTFQPVLQALQAGQNPQQLFYQMCSSRGVNPQDILNQLK